MSRIGHLAEIGSSGLGEGHNYTLYVNPNGTGTDGKTWKSAYTTIQDALDAADVLMTNASDCTRIEISPHATYYDIDTAGDPTWTGNYMLAGTHRNWAKIKNDNAGATSVLKFTGKVSLLDLNINLGTGNNGVIFTNGGFRVDDCMFVGEDLTGAATAIHADGATYIKNGKIRGCDIKGEATSTHMTGILLDNAECADILNTRIGFCDSGLQQVGANSSFNRFKDSEFCTCAIAANLDAGSAMSFENVLFYENTVNIDDEIGGHAFNGIKGNFPITITPDDFSGVTVADGAAGAWGADVEIRSAASATVPFRIVGVNAECDKTEIFRIRLTDGTTYFDDLMTFGDAAAPKREPAAAPSGTEFIFNAGTAIDASVKTASGNGTAYIWLEIQEI